MLRPQHERDQPPGALSARSEVGDHREAGESPGDPASKVAGRNPVGVLKSAEEESGWYRVSLGLSGVPGGLSLQGFRRSFRRSLLDDLSHRKPRVSNLAGLSRWPHGYPSSRT